MHTIYIRTWLTWKRFPRQKPASADHRSKAIGAVPHPAARKVWKFHGRRCTRSVFWGGKCNIPDPSTDAGGRNSTAVGRRASLRPVGLELAVTDEGTLCCFSRWDRRKLCQNQNFCPGNQPEKWGTKAGPWDLHPSMGSGDKRVGSGAESCKGHHPAPRRLSPAAQGCHPPPLGLSPTSPGRGGVSIPPPTALAGQNPPEQM